MSEPLRWSRPGVTEGQEPGEGIANPETVEGGTLAPTSEAAAEDKQVDPEGHPHAPSVTQPEIPTDAATEEPRDEAAPVRRAREETRDDDGQGSWGPAPE